MKKSNEATSGEAYNKFWFGFAVGSAFCGLAAMAVGTKQGRKFIKKSIDYMDQIDGTSDQIHTMTNVIHQFTKSLIDDTAVGRAAADISAAVNGMVEEIREPVSQTPTKTEAKKEAKLETKKVEDNTLDSIIDKMRNFSTGKKTDAKYFKKAKK